MRTVAVISEHASPLAEEIGGKDNGGQHVYVRRLAIELSRNDYSIDIFTRWSDPHTPEIVEWLPGIRVIHIKAGPAEAFPKEEHWKYTDTFVENMYLFLAADQFNYELIHANYWMSGYVAMKLKERLAIPYVITFHGLGCIQKLHLKQTDEFLSERCTVEKQVADQADQVIAECPQDQEDLIRHYGLDPAKISVVPCGFSTEEFIPVGTYRAKKQLGFAEDEHIILHIGRLVERKGVDTIIKSLTHINTDKKIKLVIVGGEHNFPDFHTDPGISRLYLLAKELRVDHLITFAGQKDRNLLKYYYSAADVFVTTPWYEPFGITPLESMACGTPVIGSKVGGIKHSIIDGETGFLVEPNNPKALAEKIEKLINDPSLLLYMERQAFIHVNLKFTWQDAAKEISNMYDAVAKKQNNSISAFKTETEFQPLIPQQNNIHYGISQSNIYR